MPRLAGGEIAGIVAPARPRVGLAVRPYPGSIETSGGAPATIDHARIGATLLYTSGTTGRPKGCWRTAEQESARADELRTTYALSGSDTHLIVCPLAHSAPGIFLRAARAAGARTAISPRFTPDTFIADVREHRASVVFLVPTQVHRLLALPPPHLDSLRAVIVAAGEPPPPRPPIAQPCRCSAGCAEALAEARMAAGPEAWRAWLAVRDACTLRDHRYGEDQIHYHYLHTWLVQV